MLVDPARATVPLEICCSFLDWLGAQNERWPQQNENAPMAHSHKTRQQDRDQDLGVAWEWHLWIAKTLDS